jgi:hypothetical protein
LYNILVEFIVHMRLPRPIKICLNETYIEVCIYKYLYDNIDSNITAKGRTKPPYISKFALI